MAKLRDILFFLIMGARGARPSDDVFQHHRLARHRELHLFQKCLRGDDGFDVALPDARGERFFGDGIIEIHRHLAQQQRRVIDQRARHRRRQQYADHALPRPDAPQTPGQENGSHERGIKIHFRILRVSHGKAQGMLAGGMHEGDGQRTHPRLPMLPGPDEEFLDGGTHLERRGRVRQRPAVVDGDRIRQPPRQFPQKPAFLETEDAAPHAVEADRNDRRLDVLHDALEAAPERQQMADARDLSLGKNADHLTGADGIAGRLQRLDHFARALFGGDGDDAEDARERFDVRQFVMPLVHHEPHLPVRGREQQQGVHKRNVVANEQRAALGAGCGRGPPRRIR